MDKEQRLSANLILRSIENDRDVENFVEFNTSINGFFEGMTCSILLKDHPLVKREEFNIVIDEATGKIASCTCLIPWVCSIEGIDIKTEMIEMVVTHPDYRKLGLIKKQFVRLDSMIDEKKSDISIIWGIPYYYRQYGYSYCIEGNTSESLPSYRIPDPVNKIGYELRIAKKEDLPDLERFYRESVSTLDLFVQRDSRYWDYLLDSARLTFYIVCHVKTGRAAGYVVLLRKPDSSSVTVLESGMIETKSCIGILQLLKEEGYKEILVNWPKTGMLAKMAIDLGSIKNRNSQWLLRIRDMADFLMKISPVINRRLSGSYFCSISTILTINFFRYAIELEIVQGKLINVKPAGFMDYSMGADGGDLCIPMDAFMRLLFGQNDIDSLFDAWPDILLKPQSRALIEIIFPRINAYIHMPYHYYGPKKA